MLEKLIAYAVANDCSDIHITPKLPPVFRKDGQLFPGDFPLDATLPQVITQQITNDKQKKLLAELQDIDFCYVSRTGQRQRVNIYHQNGGLAIAMRVLRDKIPSFADLDLPPVMQRLAEQPRGLILVTGPTGSGKSTTLAAMIDYINMQRKCHILTIEDPVEYLHQHKSSMVHQREIGKDVSSFSEALRSSLREDPDVILVGEMRDLETISAAVTAAETGHLVLSTLHTIGAAATIDRIIDVFPPHGQGQIRTQLASVLKGVVSQQLVPLIGGGRKAALEVLLGTDGAMNMIRENKGHQISSIMQTGIKEGMCTLNYSLAQLVSRGKITLDTAIERASDKFELMQLIK